MLILEKKSTNDNKSTKNYPGCKEFKSCVMMLVSILAMISAQKEEKLLKMNADTLVRIVCFM